MTRARTRELSIETPRGPCPARLVRPPDAFALYVFAHGAGAGMHHVFMESMSAALAEENVATLRYAFPYLREKGAGFSRPDPPSVLHATVRAALAAALEHAGDLPCFLGGKSMGGRMSSEVMASASTTIEPRETSRVRGLVFLGFPLHLAKKPATKRGEHLAQVKVPMLFLSGDRDALCDLGLFRPLLAKLAKSRKVGKVGKVGKSKPRLHVVEGADHGFAVLRRSGRMGDEVMRELAQETASFLRAHVAV